MSNLKYEQLNRVLHMFNSIDSPSERGVRYHLSVGHGRRLRWRGPGGLVVGQEEGRGGLGRAAPDGLAESVEGGAVAAQEIASVLRLHLHRVECEQAESVARLTVRQGFFCLNKVE
jgi:hypothetical protein